VGPAFDEAVARLRAEYDRCTAFDCNADVRYHVVLTVERPTYEHSR
jgi:ribosomal protein S12 methylthiotransferase accessory factor YcaO